MVIKNTEMMECIYLAGRNNCRLSEFDDLKMFFAGMAYNTGETLGRMEWRAQTAQFHLGGTSHMLFR